MPVRVAILVASDSRSAAGEKRDQCIPALSEFAARQGFAVVKSAICPDEVEPLRRQIREWAASGGVDVILTSGGTGVSPRDVTPEATRPLLDRELPGIPEAMRAASLAKTVRAVVSRGVAGLIKGVLVINLPGSPAGAVENLAAVAGAIAHIVEKANGDASECAAPGQK